MKKFLILFSFFVLMLLQSCIYRTPTDDDVCVLPKTNNPSITGDRGRTFNTK